MRTSRLTLALIGLIGVIGGCAVPSGDAMLRYGPLDIDGDFGVRSKGSTGPFQKSDVKAAGFGKDKGVLGLRGDVDFGSPTLTITLQNSSHGGVGVVTERLDDGKGNVIEAGSSVSSNLDLGLYQGLLTFDLIPTDTVDVGLGAGLTGVDFDAVITDITTPAGDTITESQFIPIPLLAVDAGVELGALRAGGTLSGMAITISGDSVTYLDLDLNARYRLLGSGGGPAGSIGLGYRLLDLDVEYEDDYDIEVGLRFNGPYFGLIFSF